MNSTPSESTTPSNAPFLTLWDHFKDELLVSDFDSFEELKRERVINFFGIPWAIEKLMVFGFFICMDSFLYTFTILPLRILLVLYTVTVKFISNFRHEEKRSIYLNMSQKCDLLKAVLIILVCISLQSVDAAQMYHSIRGQSVIKLYVIFNVLEIFDKLCCAFGGDILDSLFSKSTLSDEKSSPSSRHLRPISHFFAAFFYILCHTIILFYQAITLNVAINSYSNALLTLLLSNQFIEIKGSVFKRFEKENLFQLSCSDIVERFQLALFLTVITVRNLIELSGSPSSPFSILPTSFIPLFPAKMTTVETLLTPVIIVLASELLVDWLKHAFITKFNQIRPSVYDRFIDILSRDLVIGNNDKPSSENHKRFTDQSPMVSRRIGFAALPLACLTIRVSSQIVTMISDSIQEIDAEERSNLAFTSVFTQPSGVWIFCGFAIFVILIFIKLLVGINLIGFAHRRYATMERREAEERVRTQELDAHVAKEKEQNQLGNQLLDDPKDNVLGQQKPVITLDNIDRYTLFKSRIP